MRAKCFILVVVTFGLLAGYSSAAASPSDASDPTPPRLSFVDGQVSFFRPGADDWVEAQINTPLSPGDQLYTGSPGNVELQVGERAFVRGWANTQIGLENQEPAFLQFKVTSGYAAFDLRVLAPGHTVEVDTPNAAFTIDDPGYYRVDVNGTRTSFTVRRSGKAIATTAAGRSVIIAPSEEVILEGINDPTLTAYAAPPLDEWDEWNYVRTDELLDAISARYIPPGTYGASDLDDHGSWRIMPTYGPVWIPTGVPAGWAPYTSGAWTMDPYYGWTWVDTAPWGWAPYHYGRWVHVNNFWAWAPGPLVARPVYAPALVAFIGGPGLYVSVSSGPMVGWVALGWGEPLVPWWGRPGFIHRPWWGGWGGPRMVNTVVVHRTTVVRVNDIHHYHNMKVRNGVVAVSEKHFGRGRVSTVRIAHMDDKSLELNRKLPGRSHATPASYTPHDRRGIRPSEENLKRAVVATRPRTTPRRIAVEKGPKGSATETMKPRFSSPEPRIVASPKRREATGLTRATIGQGTDERTVIRRDSRPSPPANAIRGQERNDPAPDRYKPNARASESRPSEPSRPANRPASESRQLQQSPEAHPGKQIQSPQRQPSPERRALPERKAMPQPNAVTQPKAVPDQPSVQANPSVRDRRPSLPGQPANSMSPNGRERRSYQHMEREPQSAPSRSSQPARQNGRSGGARRE